MSWWNLLTGILELIFNIIVAIGSVVIHNFMISSIIVAAVLLTYVASCYRDPYALCLRCYGTNKIFGWWPWTYRHCSCDGQERRRYAARFFGWY